MDYALSEVTRTGEKEPLGIEEAKAHLKPDGTDDDTLITAMITAVAEAVEDVQARVLRKGTLELSLAVWPESGVIRIPRFPLVSVEAIEYLKAGEVGWTTYPASNYRVLTDRAPPRIVLKQDARWPTASLETGDAVRVKFTAGYEDGKVPEKAKQTMRLLLGHWYENRGAVELGTIATTIPDSYRALVLSDRLW